MKAEHTTKMAALQEQSEAKINAMNMKTKAMEEKMKAMEAKRKFYKLKTSEIRKSN